MRLFNDLRYSPPPSVNPATPTPGKRRPTTFTPVPSSASYLIPSEANSDLNCPTSWINISLVEARHRYLYAHRRGKSRVSRHVLRPPSRREFGLMYLQKCRSANAAAPRSEHFTILLTSSAGPGSTERIDASDSRKQKEQGVKCRTSIRMTLDNPLGQIIINERTTHGGKRPAKH